MLNLKRRALAVATAVSVAAGLGAAAPLASASAGTLCSLANVCGNLENIGSTGIGVQKDWNTSRNYDRILYPGQGTRRTLGWADTDAFYIGSGYCANNALGSKSTYWRGPVKVKISDLQSMSLRAYRC